MLRQLIRFAGVGAVATLLQYLILLTLVEGAAVDPVLASGTGYGLSSIFNYCANHRYTFASGNPHSVAAIRFVAVAATGLALNTALMYLLVAFLALQYFLAQLLSTGISMAWNFFANRLWTYGSA